MLKAVHNQWDAVVMEVYMKKPRQQPPPPTTNNKLINFKDSTENTPFRISSQIPGAVGLVFFSQRSSVCLWHPDRRMGRMRLVSWPEGPSYWGSSEVLVSDTKQALLSATRYIFTQAGSGYWGREDKAKERERCIYQRTTEIKGKTMSTFEINQCRKNSQ